MSACLVPGGSGAGGMNPRAPMIVACWPGRAGLGYQADVGEFGDAFDEDDVRGLDVAMSAQLRPRSLNAADAKRSETPYVVSYSGGVEEIPVAAVHWLPYCHAQLRE